MGIINIDAPAQINAPITFSASAGSIDFGKNQAVNFIPAVASTAPSNPVIGLTYYDSAKGKIGIYTSAGWTYLSVGDMTKSEFLDGSNKLNLSALPAHASTHKSGGADAIRVNELAAPNGSLSMNGYTITGVQQATNDSDVPNYAQVKALFAGIKWKQDVRTVATSNIILSGTQTINGVAISTGRVLCTAQSNGYENLIYNANSSGAWVPAEDSNSITELLGAHVEVTEGDFANTEWKCKVGASATYGTTSIPWSKEQVGSALTADANGALSINSGVAKVLTDGTTIEIIDNKLQIPAAYRKKTYTVAISSANANTEMVYTNPTASLNCDVTVLDTSGNIRTPAIRITTSSIYVTFAFAIPNSQYTMYIQG